MSEDAAIKAALDTLTKALAGKAAAQGPTFAEIWRRYFREEGRYNDTAKDIERRGQLLCAFWGDRPALECTTAAVEDYRDVRRDPEKASALYEKAGIELRRKEPAIATINREVACGRRALQWAVENNPPLLPYNPLGAVKLEQEKNVRQIGHRSEEDLQRLLSFADPEERAAILLYIDCGPRRMEVLSLQWTQFLMVRVEVDGVVKNRPMIHLWNTKNRDPRRIGITWRAYEAVQALPRHGRYVFPGRRPGRYRHAKAPVRPGAHLTPDAFNRRIKRLCKKAGVFAENGSPLTIHDFRHWFVYVATVVHGAPRAQVKKQTGHVTDSAHDRYGIGGEEGTAMMFENIERSQAEKGREK